MQEFGWTVRKRRRIREEIKMINACHLMHSALATSCKCIYNVRTDQCSKKFQLENSACDQQYALEVFNGIVDEYFQIDFATDCKLWEKNDTRCDTSYDNCYGTSIRLT